ncbi:GNAT family N-acetyltransferase [Streptomyces sp. ASQP_92]|uniref:GNAT family N-acetyltransferase n=1 Tax=Streptomyces sp. ASQP_92 TaxID=2979116 RepID=UPI0021BF628C|nr:GNAT family protein [Streptomyces sp. ASQP_92]MCT9091251.1 GNAT family N-acetyltransferase [Streptomyces sp. ASQP_92]
MLPVTVQADRIALFELTRASAAELQDGGSGGWEWAPGGPHEGSRFAAAKMLAGIETGRHRTGWGAYVMVRAEDGRAIGGIGFHGPPEDGRVEIGYDLAESARGQGYATESLAALTAWALAQPGVETVYATTDEDNTASQRVLNRAGFTRVGDTPRTIGCRPFQYLFERGRA